MKVSLRSLILTASMLACSAIASRADDTPPPQHQPAPTQQQPEHGNAPGSTPSPHARKEEEADTVRAGHIAKLAATFRSKTGLADEIASLRARAEKAESEHAAALKQIDALTKENARLKADWQALEEAAASLGDGKDDKQQTSPEHQKAASVINQQVAKELRAIGHVPKDKTESPQKETAKTTPAARPTLAQAAADMWASRGGVYRPGLN